MAVRKKDPEESRLSRALPVEVGEALTDDLAAIRRDCAALPILDSRPEREILGYDDVGLPT